MTTISAMSPYVGNTLINYFLKATDYNPTSGSIYVGLYTVTPSDTRKGTEVNGGGYARQPITFDFNSGSAINNKKVTFPQATTNWGRIVGVAILNTSSPSLGGNVLFWGNIYNPLDINDGEIYSINVGALTIELKGAVSGGWGIGTAGSALNLILDNDGFGGSPPSNAYMALGTNLTTDSSYGFVSWDELSAGSYSRQLISASSWNTPSNGASSNNGDIIFYAPPIPEEWGRITNIVIYDSASGGNTLMWGKLSTPLWIITGDGLKFASGNVGVSIT